MSKKKQQKTAAKPAPFRTSHFTPLKGMDIVRETPETAPQPAPCKTGPDEKEEDLFLRAMSDVKALHSEQSGVRKSDRSAIGGEDETVLFRRAMAGVKTMDQHQHVTAFESSSVAPPCEPLRSSTAVPSGDSQESSTLFLQEISRLKLETRFADSIPDEDELKPLAGNRLRQVKRGVIAVSHQLDLHGLTREEALASLPRFLEMARRRGQKAALVITGKGINSPAEPVLQQAVAAWLREAGRGMVLEFAPAPREMGGSGAYVVFLRPLPEPATPPQPV